LGEIGEEIAELLEIKPLTVFVRRIVRPKYALPKEQEIVIAELPRLPIPKANASVSLLAFILVSKFVDHLPLYRLLQIFKRQELNFTVHLPKTKKDTIPIPNAKENTNLIIKKKPHKLKIHEA